MSIQDEVIEWHSKTFPNATHGAIIDKLIEEATELSEVDGEAQETCDEIADVVIVACSLLGRWGLKLDDIVRAKLEINSKRAWGDEIENGDRPRVK